METILKPNEKYFKLSPREATLVAVRAAKKYGSPRQPDMALFKRWTQEYNERYEKQTTLC